MSAAAAPFTIEPAPGADAEVDHLLAEAFGPGRYAKTAYRLRERSGPVPWARFVARREGRAIGFVEFWPLDIGGQPALLLGPLAVSPAFKNEGVGLALMRHGLEAARAGGHTLVVLVGDQPYYARAGFVGVPPGQIRLPGPVDPARLLAVELAPGALAAASGLAKPVRQTD